MRKTKPKSKPERAPPEVRQLQEQILAQIEAAAHQCTEVERQFGQSPAPELETLIKLHRVLIFKFSLEAEVAPELLKLVKDLMKPVMEWAQLEEKRNQRKFAEKRHSDRVKEQKAAQDERSTGSGLKPETLARIERELNLF